MNRGRVVSFLLTAFVTGVGLLFLTAVILDLPPLQVKSSGSYVLLVVSLFFLVFGLTYGYLMLTGKLERKGKTISELRQEAVEKMRDQGLLVRIAQDDPNPGVRKAAQERLQELST